MLNPQRSFYTVTLAAAPLTTGVSHNNWSGIGFTWSGTLANFGSFWPSTSRLQRLRIEHQNLPGAGASWLYECLVDGVQTGPSLTLDNTALSQNSGNLIANVVPGDHVVLRCTPSSSPAPAAAGFVRVIHECISVKGFPCLSHISGGTAINHSQTKKLALQHGGISGDFAEGKPSPGIFTVGPLYVKCTDPVAGTLTVTLYVNTAASGYSGFVAQTLTCQVAGGSTSNSDTNSAHYYTMQEGDVGIWDVTTSAATADGLHVFVGAEMIPDIHGDMFLQGETINQAQNTTRYQWCGIPAAPTATESLAQAYMYAATVMKPVAICSAQLTSYANPPAGQTCTNTIRKNGVGTAVTWIDTGTTQIVTDNGTSVDFDEGQYISQETVLSATWGSSTSLHQSYKFRVPQNRMLASTGVG